MPSSFKRREPGHAKAQAQGQHASEPITTAALSAAVSSKEGEVKTQIPSASRTTELHSGLRPCPFPSPVPLFSTGLASLDDLICGNGVPSSSLIALCPGVGLTSISAESGFGGATTGEGAQTGTAPPIRTALSRSSQQSTSRVTLDALHAAEHTLAELLSYGVAQGLVAEHHVLVIGQGSLDLVESRVPTRASLREEATATVQDQQTPSKVHTMRPVGVEAAEKEQDDDSMTIAFRYAHRPKFRTTVDEPEAEGQTTRDTPFPHRYRAPFDTTRRMLPADVQNVVSRPAPGLRIEETTRYDEAIALIEREAMQCIRSSSAPPLRIHLLSLGSSAWGKPSDSTDRRIIRLSRFLVRLRRTIKHLVLERGDKPLHVLCTVTVSSSLLVPPWRTLVTHHLLRFFDVQVLLSDFARDERLRRAYAGYGGSVCLLKGPAIATLLPPGEHRSILRGGGGEAGAENDVGWRRRKRGKGIVLETLHEDVDASAAAGTTADKGAAVEAKPHGDDIEDSATGLPRRPFAAAQKGHDGHSHQHQHAHPATDTATGSDDSALVGLSSVRTASGPRLQGLKALRERGLRAAEGRQQADDEAGKATE